MIDMCNYTWMKTRVSDHQSITIDRRRDTFLRNDSNMDLALLENLERITNTIEETRVVDDHSCPRFLVL